MEQFIVLREVGSIVLGLRTEGCRYIWTTDLEQVNRYPDIKQADRDSQISIFEMSKIRVEIESEVHIVLYERARELWKESYPRATESDEQTTVYYDGKTVYFPLKRNEKYKRLVFGNDLLLIDLVPWERDIERIHHFYLKVKEEMKDRGYLIFMIDRGKLVQLMERCRRLWVICLD